MSLKFFSNKFLIFFSFLFSFLALAFFSSYKIPALSNYISLDANKNLVLLLLSTIALILYVVFAVSKKEIYLPDNKLVRLIFLLFPVVVLLSSLFSGNFVNSLFGKYVFLQSGASYIAIFFLTYIISSYFKIAKRMSWLLFVLANFFVSISVILGILLVQFGASNIANKMVFFVDNWDTVSAVCGVVIIFSLVYYETIAYTKLQKIISGILLGLHLLLLVFVIMPDIWYILSLASLFVFIIATRKEKHLEEGEIKKKKGPIFYKKLSFYVLVVSVVFSVIFMFSGSFTSKLANNIANFSNKYFGVNYNFVKPKLNLSMSLAGAEIKSGRLLGAGPAEFYKVWQSKRPQSVMNSNYWSTDFSSSYSAFTTSLVTLGVVGTALVVFILVIILINIWHKIRSKGRENSYLDLDDENKFYFLASVTLFIYSVLLYFLFVNVMISVTLLALSIGFILPYIVKWKETSPSKLIYGVMFLLTLVVLASTVANLNRVRSAYVAGKAMSAYQASGDLNALENSLLKSVRISSDDSNYRLLTQYYVFKTRQILNSNATNTEQLQKDVITAMNNAIMAAQTAISLDGKDYNNYVNLAGAEGFIMTFDKQNRDTEYQSAKAAYEKALSLNPKSPSIYLSLAQLEYAYSQNNESTIANIQQAINIKPNYSSAFYLLSQLAVQNNNRDGAIQYASEAIKSDSQNVDAYLQYGILTLNKKNLSQDELNQAYTAFVSVLNMDPNNITAAYYLAITYTLAKEMDKAKEVVNALKNALPNDSRILDLEKYVLSSGSAPAQPTATTTKKTIKK